MKRFFVGSLLAISLGLIGCANRGSVSGFAITMTDEDGSPPKLVLEEIALGAAVYAQNCAECHGENLEGEPDWKQQNEDGSFRSPPHSADGHTWHHADRVLLRAIKEGGTRFEGMNIGGTSNMPAYAGTLTEEEILAVLAFIKSTWPDDIRALQWQQTKQDTSP